MELALLGIARLFSIIWIFIPQFGTIYRWRNSSRAHDNVPTMQFLHGTTWRTIGDNWITLPMGSALTHWERTKIL